MTKKSASSLKPAKAAAKNPTESKSAAGRTTPTKAETDEPKKPSKAERQKAHSMRRKRIIVIIVSVLLIIAFCLPSAIYLISGASSNSDTEEETVDYAAEYQEQIDEYLTEVSTDPSLYKRIAAVYTEWAGDVVDGTITDSEYTADELYGHAVENYESYFANDPDATTGSYRSLAGVYEDWGDGVASGSITSENTAEALYTKAVETYQVYYEKSGKASAYDKLSSLYQNWAYKVGCGTITESSYTCDELYSKAIEALQTKMGLLDGDVTVYAEIGDVYKTWAGYLDAGTLTASSAAASDIWAAARDAYKAYLDAAETGTDDYYTVACNYATCLENLDDIDGARAVYRDVVTEDPTYLSAWLYLAYTYEDAEDNVSAQAVYQEMCDANPDNAYAWYYSGSFLSGIDDTSGAQYCYEKALEVDPDDTYGLKSFIEMMIENLTAEDEEDADADADAEEAEEEDDAE